MKFIKLNILKILAESGDLLRLERKMRKDRVVVNKIPGGGRVPDKSLIRPWKPLPSICEFKCDLALYDWLFLLFGYSKRYKPSLTFTQWKNNGANRYIDYMFKRLHKQVQLERYFDASRTMWILMRSTAYQTCCFNYVLKNWHRELKWQHVKLVVREVKLLCESRATYINYSRVYLDEGVKWRPLGVPTLSWRVYLHMYNNLIVQWRLTSEGDKQHAYLPRRGVITAWERLIDRLSTAPNIYEADFKGFFNNVTHLAIEKELWEMGVPDCELDIATGLNKSFARLCEDDKIKELDRDIPLEYDRALNLQSGVGNIGSGPLLREIPIKGIPRRGLKAEKAFDPRPPLIRINGVDYEPDQLIRIRSKNIREKNLWGLFIIKDKIKELGVPQGAATSCSFATLVLRGLERLLDVLIYADDIIWFPKSSSEDPNVLNSEVRGIEVNYDKSGWSKMDGVWVKDFVQFLGIRYYPARGAIPLDFWHIYWLTLLLDILFLGLPLMTGIMSLIFWRDWNKRINPVIRAATRKGANLEFTSKEGFLTYLNNARTNLLNTSAREVLRGNMLEEWLLKNASNYKYFWVSTLFRDTSPEYSTSPRSPTYRAKWGPPLKGEVAHIPITGWIFSRMQLGKWNHELQRKQDFRLGYVEKSWMGVRWGRYAYKHIIPRDRISVFTASSFASNDLMQYLDKLRPLIRRVKSDFDR